MTRGEPLQAESDSESRTCPRSSKPASKSDRKAKPFLPIQAGEAASYLTTAHPDHIFGTFMMHHNQKAAKPPISEGKGRSILLTPSTSPRDRNYGLTFGEEVQPRPEVKAVLAAEFRSGKSLDSKERSEQDYLGECNKNWKLLAAAECFAHAAIRRRSAQGIRA
ncbi:hypothetical protein HAX54_044126 [Datura stramonium]|uniref:Uncharacterized protein n=1 Tax=Datura stramonium TaxID=4076 RepID=A0ABS8W4C4_DATST|nr:hypothetical protein [Datura stramonium]